MSYCLNPHCSQPENTDDVKFCQICDTKLLLKERYRAIKPIGQGGFGRTFLAVDEDKPSKPPCVIKQFLPQGTNTVQKAVDLFNQEAIQLDELGQHSQIPALLAYCNQDDRQYLVQEFIDGLNLYQELEQNGAFNETQIRQLLNDLLLVLQFCHSKQVIHRDIKPENIIRRNSDRKLVIVDFGAAKSATGTALNRTGTIIGSAEYVAPEQMRGKALFASDIYSLGVTCINLLTERSPFDSYDTHNAAWIWGQYLKTPVSKELSQVIDKMIESIPSHRYQTVEEVLQDLNFQQSSVPPKQITSPTSQPPSVVKISSEMEKELQEMKTQFTGGKPQPQNVNSQPQSPSNNPIDKELEEMKSKFLGNG
ncbi:serine/threonine protein kinase [Dolichospermum sp. ST_con]|nr:serine/threonine protein kinase [Dolichospermum sp. ST_con]MDD1420223.1 serine/threonine protein kinase [Dolichospermum sp. ST_sed1]MDD1423785.1 serine/threonine protein kinase [Dolichospermum sp. ST_sed9]MDD1432892.1 serine/threonine protein kinase [Dolichospermum sp. ST_sed6]MDD1436461.1 serine/threonine protein kinase [Dolichospermum sp. ST_sed10]MDD1442326.1 serine/threonine protein kinase [Dolichospermum sp. ST_sed3]MDD1447500.1 serine/threonine protein kinase [Dolichospermum sp. ST_s